MRRMTLLTPGPALLISLTAFLFVPASPVRAQWEAVNIPSFNESIQAAAVDAAGGVYLACWTPGPDSWLVYSPDGGQNWQTNYVASRFLHSIDVLENGEVLVSGRDPVSDAAVLLRGSAINNYDEFLFNEGPNAAYLYYQVNFRNDQEGLLAGYNGRVLRSVDGGATWERTNTGSDEIIFREIKHSGETVVHAAAGFNFLRMTRLWRSTDGGANWSEMFDLGDTTAIRKIAPSGPQQLTVCCSVPITGYQFILFSDDDGESWNTAWETDDGEFFYDMKFGADGRGLAVASGGQLLVSDDYGRSWRQESSPISSDITACIIDESRGVEYVFGDFGLVYRRPLPATSVDAVVEPNAALVCPNPIGEEGRLHFGPRAADGGELLVVDMTGREAAHITSHGPEFELAAAALSPGIYCFQLQREGEILQRGSFVVE